MNMHREVERATKSLRQVTEMHDQITKSLRIRSAIGAADQLCEQMSRLARLSDPLQEFFDRMERDRRAMNRLAELFQPAQTFFQSFGVSKVVEPQFAVPITPQSGLDKAAIRRVVADELALVMSDRDKVAAEPPYGSDGIRRVPGFLSPSED